MRCLREVNVDHNTVGWYQVVNGKEGWRRAEVVEGMMEYWRMLGDKCVLLVYDATKAELGNMGLTAWRLTESFCHVYQSRKFTSEKLRKTMQTSGNIFSELPVTLRLSPLHRILFRQLKSKSTQRQASRTESSRLETGRADISALERNLETLIEGVDDWHQDQGQWMYWWRGAQRELSKQAQLLQRRRTENQTRTAQGLEPLPEDDVSMEMARTLPEPGRLELMLVQSGAEAVCADLERVVNGSVIKSYGIKALQ